MTQSKSRQRLPQLDFLRAIAVLLVLLVHVPATVETLPAIPRAIFSAVVRGGWAGVDLFFVLSGFLISGLLFSEQIEHGTINLKRFYIRRGLKIYPSFYFLLGLTLIGGAITGRHFKPRAVFDEIFFLQNYGPHIWYHCWSLAVEEHFYILLPIALVLAIRFRPACEDKFAILPAVFVIVAIGALSVRTLTLLYGAQLGLYNRPSNVAVQTHARFDSLLFGVLLSYYYHYHRPAVDSIFQRHAVPLLIVGIGLVLPPFFISPEEIVIPTIGYSLLYLGFGLLLMLALYHLPDNARGGWIYRACAFLGTFSYSIYLWHVPCQGWSQKLLRTFWEHPPFSVVFLTYMSGAIVIGIGAGKLIEIPVLRLRDRWLPGPANRLGIEPKPEAPPAAERVVDGQSVEPCRDFRADSCPEL